MSTTTLPPRPTLFRHEARLCAGTDELLAGTVPSMTRALSRAIPVIVAVHERTWETIRAALDGDAGRVRFVDMTRIGANPARMLAVWLGLLAEYGGRPVHAIGEPLWAGRRDAETLECHIHEAALNLAIPATTPLRMVCVYDADHLSPAALSEAHRTHSTVAGGPAPQVDSDRGAATAGLLGARRLPRHPRLARRLAFGRGGLAAVRRFVTDRCSEVDLGTARTDDLTLAINELAANSLDHAGGHGVLRSWREDDALVLQVSDSGRITDPLVGRIAPTVDQGRGRGLWLVNQVCDLVHVRSDRAGTVVRVSAWLPGR